MPEKRLVQPMFNGPVDIVGDIHGEIEALRALLEQLGYAEDGTHSQGRRLVFLGDLTDRGPDSPEVVRTVRRLVAGGRAQCLLGNHELNLLLERRCQGNAWFYGEKESLGGSWGVCQQLADEEFREATLDFIRQLPLALVRDDLRAVHACWDDHVIEQIADKTDVLQLHRTIVAGVKKELSENGYTDEVERELRFQNDNPVKRLTSGPECRAKEPFVANGKRRHTTRVRWWREYTGSAFCVFGHYWRIPVPGMDKGPNLFQGDEINAVPGGRAMCIDYSVGGRWKERQLARCENLKDHHTNLAALRWPERQLIFDDGRQLPLMACEIGEETPLA